MVQTLRERPRPSPSHHNSLVRSPRGPRNTNVSGKGILFEYRCRPRSRVHLFTQLVDEILFSPWIGSSEVNLKAF
jgi:hypothetical protein